MSSKDKENPWLAVVLAHAVVMVVKCTGNMNDPKQGLICGELAVRILQATMCGGRTSSTFHEERCKKTGIWNRSGVLDTE